MTSLGRRHQLYLRASVAALHRIDHQTQFFEQDLCGDMGGVGGGIILRGDFDNVGFGVDFDRTWHWLRGVGLLVAFAALAFLVAVRKVRLTRPTVSAPIGPAREPAPTTAGHHDG